MITNRLVELSRQLLLYKENSNIIKTMHSNRSKSGTMHSDLMVFRYATRRWLVLVGLSLITFLLILEYFPFLRTVVIRFYRRKKKRQHTISIHAYMNHTQGNVTQLKHLVSEANKFRYLNQYLFYTRKNHYNNNQQFLVAYKYLFTNK
jgi:hypothetical protein